MDLSIITVAFKSKEKLRTTIEAVLKSRVNYSYEMVVVDNGSGDGTADMVEEEFVGKYSQVRLVRNINNGFAKGNNLGIINSTGRALLLLNPDTAVQENTL